MSMKCALFAVAAALALAACARDSREESYAASPESVGAMDAAARSVPPAPPPGGDVANAGALLAYSYSMAIAAPKTHVAQLMNAHQGACLAAGIAVCQVLGASVNSYGEDDVSAYLNLRAEPQWLADFRARIAADATAAGGEITADTVSTEDLTQYITDASARLEAKKALRERIKGLLENREGSLSDVLAAERALADVQGEIDSMTASLEAAKARVAMSALSIAYSSDPETSVSLWKPLAESLKGFGRTSAQSLAEAIDFAARAWPYFILALIALAILRLWWRRRRA
jgi:vacuolar-type H+-ATPase subunit E/Vma4